MSRRFFAQVLISTGLLTLCASQAVAFAFSMVPRTATTGLGVGDTVVVDVFFDATDVGVHNFQTSVVVSNAGSIQYDAVASATLPIVHPASALYTTGAQPGYILYDPRIGAGMSAIPAVQLIPLVTPAWLTLPHYPLFDPGWTPTPTPAGQQHVFISFAEGNVTDPFDTRTTGIGIWIASLVFDIDASITSETLSLSVSSPNDYFYLDYAQVLVPPQQIGLSAPIVLTGVPEPMTGVLIGLGLSLALGLARSARSRSGVTRPGA